MKYLFPKHHDIFRSQLQRDLSNKKSVTTKADPLLLWLFLLTKKERGKERIVAKFAQIRVFCSILFPILTFFVGTSKRRILHFDGCISYIWCSKAKYIYFFFPIKIMDSLKKQSWMCRHLKLIHHCPTLILLKTLLNMT